jgi:drug/metabolite transporter (DMT)-like permease
MKSWKQLLILLPGTVWGVSFVITELILPYIPPISLTLIRGIISIVMLYSLLKYTNGYLPQTLKEWWPFMVLGATNLAIPFTLTSWGQKSIDSGLASIIISTMPLFTVLMAHFFTQDEKLNWRKGIGVFFGFAGILILIGPEALKGVSINFWAQIAVVAASLSYSYAAVYVRFVYPLQPKDLSPWAMRFRVNSAQFITSCLFLLPLSLIVDRPWTLTIPLRIWLYLIFLGIGVTMLATIVYFYLIESLGAGLASTTVYLIPVSGILLGVLILNEQFRWEMGVSLVLIVIGIVITGRD